MIRASQNSVRVVSKMRASDSDAMSASSSRHGLWIKDFMTAQFIEAVEYKRQISLTECVSK